ncbi:DUF443 family protein [Streptococcus oralis]|uniref:DUF443 family protein n=1 Tax=Streptococcus oralis subsp. oralis TaxID=1891914 RepID=A0A0F2DJ00_STROR|nr:DUF443 family protein [Streptococcus oralis]KEQ46627.1 hypothetical protein SK141_1104 [Streptococcus oralis]KJQ67590.1 hypothetical protein TZ89_00868 [Streptococcus oralis subsp. oralis]KJQ71007.1 hypothetical protein TZ92_01536 [Streptococcus oralis subsp. oralis]MBZ2076746.1 DUF443 family protein [Streptococcus oralis]
MALKFKETNKTFHKIIEVDGEKYLLDMTSISPKTYFWGSLPNEITAKCLKLDRRDMRFESLAPTISKSLGIGIGVAIGGACYRIVTNVFKSYDISHNISFKLGLFFLSIVLAYLTFRFIAFVVRHNLQQKLSSKETKYQIVFKLASSQRQLKLYKLLPILFVAVLAFYIFTDNGTEASILIINSILSLGFFTVILGMLPLRESYEKQEIIFEKIEKL